MLRTGIAWADLPREMGCSYKTCLRWLKEWTAAGVWQRVYLHLLRGLRLAGAGSSLGAAGADDGDKGYDRGAVRALLRWLWVEPRIARRGEAGFGVGRWAIERTLSWLKQYRQLRWSWDRLVTMSEAFLYLAFILIAWRYLAM